MTGLVALVTAMYKDTYVKGDTTMSNANGQVVGTRAATHDLPLLVAPVLPDNELFSVETIRVTMPGSPADPAEFGSGEATNELIPGVVKSFRISSVDKVNLTAVVFHALGGEQVRVWNGVTTVRLSATGPEIPVCSADVTCAAFQVEGAELAEKYLAEAEALLAPFEEGRRRLAEECALGSVGRDAVLFPAEGLCQPLTVRACRALALKNGLTWGGSGSSEYYAGCYAYAEDGKAYFGTSGSDAEMLQAGPGGEVPGAAPVGPIRNQWEDDEMRNLVEEAEAAEAAVPWPPASTSSTGTGAEPSPSWLPLRLPSLDTDCLLLSNQAKLEAKLEANHAASASKLAPGVTYSYHTPTQRCEVANEDTTCTDYTTIGNSLRGTQLTGTLKVGATVTSISNLAFAWTKLTGLDLSEATALTTIGDAAFSESPLTGTLKVGATVTSIGHYAFYNTRLTGLDLSEATALTTISRGAFRDAPLAGTLKVGRSVTSIGGHAFSATKLTVLDLSEATALTTIGTFAFERTALVGQEVCTPKHTCFILN